MGAAVQRSSKAGCVAVWCILVHEKHNFRDLEKPLINQKNFGVERERKKTELQVFEDYVERVQQQTTPLG